MPFYSYHCDACDKDFDEMLSMDNRDVPLKNPCPECGKKGKVRKAFVEAPRMSIDWNHRIDRPHNVGGFSDAIQRVAESPSLKGTKYAKALMDKHTSR